MCPSTDSNNDDGQTDVPQLSNPVSVTAGHQHACALDDTGVVCWGRNGYGQTDIPPLSNPIAVSGAGHNVCAIDDSGVICWGGYGDDYGMTDVPPLNNPVTISVGLLHSCALDDNGIACWGAFFSMGGQPPLIFEPSLRVVLSAPEVSECSQPNAASIQASALITEIPNDPSVLTQWFLDGDSQGYGDNIEFIAPLGDGTLTVEVTSQAGEIASVSKVITVEDTTPPEISIDFIDHRGGSVQAIARNGLHNLTIELSATDICDPEVTVTGTGGIGVVDGTGLSIHATLHEVTLQSSTFVLDADASDDSGNTGQATKELSIID
jgi:hypothetical protein